MAISSFTLDGAPNFRDLGGYCGADDRYVRRGRLFRSDALARLTDSDLSDLAPLNIGLILDLRDTGERARDPNRWPHDKPVEVVTVENFEELAAVRSTGLRERIASPTFDAVAAHRLMLRAYAAMPKSFSGVLTEIFRRQVEPSPPVTLVHCAAGKDRTGFVCAMILLALGVSRADVFEDYLLSRKRRLPQDLLRMLLGSEFEMLAPSTIAASLVMTDVHEDYLASALRSIEQDYGSVDAYLQQACTLDPERKNNFRLRLLE
ncbi:MAG: tyrosine-protein phosphatase [Rhodocyclaceae bacterium]|jgi:protein-tyrosine phosphatase|nr:tyrosine-protein phosphatase [Rhodocyclaceae bacterium]